jgi:hypothetical protein
VPTFTLRNRENPDEEHPLVADRICVKNGYWYGPSAVDEEQRVSSGPLAGQWSAQQYDAFDEDGSPVEAAECSEDDVRGT